jgi:hypothetical protein
MLRRDPGDLARGIIESQWWTTGRPTSRDKAESAVLSTTAIDFCAPKPVIGPSLRRDLVAARGRDPA